VRRRVRGGTPASAPPSALTSSRAGAASPPDETERRRQLREAVRQLRRDLVYLGHPERRPLGLRVEELLEVKWQTLRSLMQPADRASGAGRWRR
jgi:hypothetical protein